MTNFNNGKAQPLNTLIPTPNGLEYLGNLTIGDYVFDRLGKPTQIIGTYFRGPQRAYKVILSDARSTICGIDHLWRYYNKHDKFVREPLFKLLERGILNNQGRARYKIPNNNAVEYIEKDYFIDPYIIGVFLGDGCCLEKQFSLSSPDIEIVEEIERLTNSISKKNPANNYTWTFKDKKENHLLKTKDIFKFYEDYLIQYSYNKRIPYFYMLGSIQQRFALLQGLMDTDGSIGFCEGRFNVTYSTTSAGLAFDISQLAYSLGLSASITKDNRIEKYTTNVCYKVSFRIPNEIKPMLFRKCKHKCELALNSINYPKRHNYNRNIIVSVEDLGYDVGMMCIFVDNIEQLYLTDNFIVTHNTDIY